ncbi:MAG TPA: ATP synthase F0 subunit B [Eubacteriaceae bacterium]|nr:ATP synthase F0 subunit B [Eubacteriaceae bacterium]
MGNLGMVNIDFRIIAANIVNFIIFFLVVKHFFYEKIKAFMNKRTEEISTEIDEAKALKEEAEQYKAEYMKKLSEVDDEAKEILRQANMKANEKRNEIVKQAEEEAERIFKRNQVEIQREREKAAEEVKNNIVDISIFAAEKVIGDSLDKEKHYKLITDFIEEAGEAK